MIIEMPHKNCGSATVPHSAPKCPVCDNTSVVILCEVNGFKIWRCLVSATDFVWPLPAFSSLKEIYDQVNYFRGRDKGTYADYDKETGAVLPLFKEVLSEFGDDGRGRTLLDIGCAFGTHLGLALQKGWSCFGVEISSYARSVAGERYGERLLIREKISELPKQIYDLILMFDVLEHLPDPKSLFRDLYAHGAIGPRTQIIITTPNARSCDALTNPSEWIYRCPPEHLVFFSAESLRLLLREMFFPWARVDGIYPVVGAHCPSYPGEDFPRNNRLSRFSGLLCRSGVFDYPTYIQDCLNELVSVKERSTKFIKLREIVGGLSQFNYEIKSLFENNELFIEDIKIKNTVLVEKNVELENAYSEKMLIIRELSQEVSRLNSEIVARDKTIAELTDNATVETRATESELIATRETKVFRLRDAFVHQPWSVRKILRIDYLLGAVVFPQWLRVAVRPLTLKLHNFFAATHATAPIVAKSTEYSVCQRCPSLPERTKVVHIIANFMTGGSSRLVVDLFEYLGHKYDQSVITSFIPTPPAYVGLNIHEIRYPESEEPFLAILRRLQPAFIHVHYWGDSDEPWYAKAMRAVEEMGVPVVENINTPIAPYVSSVVSRYVYVSDYVRRVFGREDSNHVTIYPGSDFSHFDSPPDRAPATNCVGMVYRLERDKLNEEAILPFIRIVQKRPQTRALIVGGGSLLEPFRQAVSAAGVADRFEFTGYVSYEDLPSLYGRMSVFVAPVWKESFGQVSPFAMNMKIPVVGYDVGGICEIVNDPTLLAPPADAEQLSDIVIELLESAEMRQTVGLQQQERAQSLFSLQIMVDRYAELYEQMHKELAVK